MPAGCPLTPHQLALVLELAQGKTHGQIAAETSRTVSTIRTILHTVYRRLDVPGAAQAVIFCWRAGWITTDQLGIRVTPPPVPTGAEPSVPAHTRVYLAAFDLHLQSRTDEEKRATRQIMDRALDPMCRERGINPAGRPKRDLVEMLVAQVRAQRARHGRPARAA